MVGGGSPLVAGCCCSGDCCCNLKQPGRTVQLCTRQADREPERNTNLKIFESKDFVTRCHLVLKRSENNILNSNSERHDRRTAVLLLIAATGSTATRQQYWAEEYSCADIRQTGRNAKPKFLEV